MECYSDYESDETGQEIIENPANTSDIVHYELSESQETEDDSVHYVTLPEEDQTQIVDSESVEVKRHVCLIVL